MIVPFIISISREVILAVPGDQREAALALGATRWETTWEVVVPFAKKGIMGSIFLALARALGETMAVTMVVGNDPKIKASLFAPGYSIAAVIANEFTEATGELYTSALIELGLVLFALTIVINGLARLLIVGTDETRRKHDEPAHLLAPQNRERRHADASPACARCSRPGTLVFILGYLFVHGGSQPELGFLHQASDAGGRNRRRHGQRHRGQRQASAAGHRCSACRSDFWAASIWRNSAARTFSFVVRYVTDLLNGVPSIVIGIFAYTLIVLPQKHFSTLAGGLALGVMMIPIAVRSTEEFLRAVPNVAARRRHGAGRVQSQGDSYGGDSRREKRDHHRHHAEPGARGGRNRAAACSPVSATASGVPDGNSPPRRCR